MEKIGNGLKKIVLAGIGATAVTVEKSQEILKDLVDKGELTVEQGKVLNEELKHSVKDKVDGVKKNVSKKAEVAEILEGMSDEQISQLKALLDSFKQSAEEERAEEAAESEPEEVLAEEASAENE
jgi:polyhydroxyalkanoate synthesis regulator phasin